MNIQLTEKEINKAITDYLSGVTESTCKEVTDINIVVNRGKGFRYSANVTLSDQANKTEKVKETITTEVNLSLPLKEDKESDSLFED